MRLPVIVASTSTPGMVWLKGVTKLSPSPSAVTPSRTAWPAIAEVDTRSSRRSLREKVGRVAGGAVGRVEGGAVGREKVVQIEGDPDSPISRGRLCPKGSASEQLVNSPGRQTQVLYRPPHAREWQRLDRDKAIDMVADRFIESRRRGWQQRDDRGRLLRRTMGIAALGGATLDNEENYLIKKLFTAAGAIQIENQARI